MKTNRWLLRAVVCLLPLTAFSLSARAGAMHPDAQIAFVKQQVRAGRDPYLAAFRQLVHHADSLLAMPDHALEDFSVPGYYSDPEAHQANSKALNQDAFAAYTEALAFRLTGRRKYGRKAVSLLNAWGKKNRLYSEYDGPLVMAYAGSGLLVAAELMEGNRLWRPEDEAAFKEWTDRVYMKACIQIRTLGNNWGDWGRMGALLAASLLERPSEIGETVRLIKSDLWRKIAPDGHMPHEVVRGNNSLWYTYFSLSPMTAAFWLTFNLTGENLFALQKDGTSVKTAVDYLLYYRQHPDEWPWFKGENLYVGRHDTWPDNLVEAMYGIWHDPVYLWVRDTRPHCYPTHHYAWVYPTLMPLSLTGYGKE